jgi:hypothetical protein
VKATWAKRQRTKRQSAMPIAPTILSPIGLSSRFRGLAAAPMLQPSNVVPFITAMTAGPSMTQSVKVLPVIAISPAFQWFTASTGSQTASFSKLVRATMARPAASAGDIFAVSSVMLASLSRFSSGCRRRS